MTIQGDILAAIAAALRVAAVHLEESAATLNGLAAAGERDPEAGGFLFSGPNAPAVARELESRGVQTQPVPVIPGRLETDPSPTLPPIDPPLPPELPPVPAHREGQPPPPAGRLPGDWATARLRWIGGQSTRKIAEQLGMEIPVLQAQFLAWKDAADWAGVGEEMFARSARVSDIAKRLQVGYHVVIAKRQARQNALDGKTRGGRKRKAPAKPATDPPRPPADPLPPPVPITRHTPNGPVQPTPGQAIQRMPVASIPGEGPCPACGRDMVAFSCQHCGHRDAVPVPPCGECGRIGGAQHTLRCRHDGEVVAPAELPADPPPCGECGRVGKHRQGCPNRKSAAPSAAAV